MGQAAKEKGIFVIKGDGVTIENIGFFGARVRDRNGAGIRLERGRLRVVGCIFEGNENGILTSNNASVELQVSIRRFSTMARVTGIATIYMREESPCWKSEVVTLALRARGTC